MTGLPSEITSKYEVLAMMGEGGMGSVYKVRHRFLDDIQVIKLMQAKFQKNEELRARFLREAKTAKQLRHPNIAEVTDFSIASDGTAYIVMEYIDGIDLREVLRRNAGPLDYKLVIDLALQSLSALAFLHKKGFVHRDISPDNLMLTRDAQGKPFIKLIDLGIAKSVEGTMNLTNDGRFIGKVQYASPEQFGGVDGRSVVDARSDLYSFGIVLYELLTNTEPILGSDARAIMAGHLTRKPRSFDESDPKGRVPQPLREIVFVALEKEREDRFQSADAFADALRSVIAPSQTLVQPRRVVDVTLDEYQAWEQAVRANTVRGWERFLDGWGSGEHGEEARERLEALEELEEADWNQASIVESVDVWRTYLARHGESTRASKARRRLEKLEQKQAEELAWSLAEQAGTITAWEEYLRKHERSSRATDARLRLHALREQIAEEQAWKDAELVDSSSAWTAYLDRHPASPRAPAAQDNYRRAVARELDDRDWDAAMAANSVPAWSDYLEKHPNSSRAAQAQSHRADAEARDRERAAWENALLADSSDAWAAYLAECPSSLRWTNAKERLERARRREQAAAEEEARLRLEREEETAWTAAVAAASVDGWDAFLRKHSASRRLPDAERHLAQARKKELAEKEWRAIVDAPAIAALESFVTRHGDSAHLPEARRRLEELRQEEQRKANEEARRRAREAEERAWLDARGRDTIKAWEGFLASHPASPRASEARRRDEERREKEKARRREEAREADRRAAAAKNREEDERNARELRERELQALRLAEARTIARTTIDPPVAENVVPSTIVAPPVIPSTVVEPVPSTVIQPLPIADLEPPRTVVVPYEPPPSPSRRRNVFMAAAAALVLVLALVIKMVVSSPAPVTDTTTTTTQPPVATLVPGQLAIDASPWGQIESVTDAKGKEYLREKPAFTPLLISLPAGTYNVKLTNPNSKQTRTLSAQVEPQKVASCVAQLDTVTAGDYLEKIGLENK